MSDESKIDFTKWMKWVTVDHMYSETHIEQVEKILVVSSVYLLCANN